MVDGGGDDARPAREYVTAKQCVGVYCYGEADRHGDPQASQIVKLTPQPQLATAFGLTILN